jgi:Outer membrane protein beta-barrel domain
MKRITILLGCFLFILTAKGQDGVATFGVKIGAVSPSLRGKDVDSISNAGPAKSLQGITFGVFANSRVGKHVWLKHEVMYSNRQMTVQLKDAHNPTYSANYGRHYIDIFPMSPTFHIKGFQLYAGPYFGILSQAWVNRKDSSGVAHKDYSVFGSGTQFYKQHQKFDLGLVTGVEYEFGFGLNLGIKYVLGYVPVIEYANANTFNDPHTVFRIYNSYLSATVGYTLSGRDRDKDSKKK